MLRRELLCHVFNAGAAGVVAQLLPLGRFASAAENPFAANPSKFARLWNDFAVQLHDLSLTTFDEVVQRLNPFWAADNEQEHLTCGSFFHPFEAQDQLSKPLFDENGVGNWAALGMRGEIKSGIPRLRRDRTIGITTIVYRNDNLIYFGTIFGRQVPLTPNEPVTEYVRLASERYLP